MAAKSRSRKEPKNGAETTAEPFPLAEEVETFEAHLQEWLDREGQWVLIKGSQVIGFYQRDEDALKAGYERFGPGPFLVKQILRYEPIYQVGNIDL